MSLKNSSVATIKTRIRLGNLTPYDECHSLELFLKALTTRPKLQESLDSQLESNPDWVAKAAVNEIFFILNDSRWKRPKNVSFDSKVRLSFVGPEKVPTISIDL